MRAEEESSNISGNKNKEISYEFAILGGGCFWCTEAVFEKIDGVVSVVSGYAGGASTNPTYKEICTGKSGHAEVIKIKFNPAVITFAKILDMATYFWLCIQNVMKILDTFGYGRLFLRAFPKFCGGGAPPKYSILPQK